MIVKIMLCLLWLIFVPILLGMFYTYFYKKEKNNVILIFLAGYFIEFTLFEFLTIPMTFLRVSYRTLFYCWSILIGILSLFSILLNIKNLKELFFETINKIKKWPMLTIVVILLILLQMILSFKYMHIDDDDAFYVANATTSISTNTINRYNPTRGNEWNWQARYVLAPFPIYLAVISELICIHPAIVAHTIFPIIFLPMVYMIFGLIANKLFNKDKKQVMLFLLFLNILYLFGNYSRRTSFSVLFLRIWQGKAILANIIIPAIWYFVLESVECEKDKSNNKLVFLMLICVMTSACLVSSMGVALAPITLMSMILCIVVRDKKISYLFKYLISCLPCLICGVIYLILI